MIIDAVGDLRLFCSSCENVLQADLLVDVLNCYLIGIDKWKCGILLFFALVKEIQ